MSSTTPNIGLTKTTAAETIGQNWAASNDSGGNFDIIDTKMGAVGNTSLQAQVTALNSKLESGSWTTVTVDSNTNYTVPDNGTLYIYISPSDQSAGYWIGTISDWRTIRINFNSGFNEAVYIPVCAGDVIKFSSATSNITSVLMQFRKMR